MCIDGIDLGLLTECVLGFKSVFLHMNTLWTRDCQAQGGSAMLLSEIRNNEIKTIPLSDERS